jgi:hypothetical protein
MDAVGRAGSGQHGGVATTRAGARVESEVLADGRAIRFFSWAPGDEPGAGGPRPVAPPRREHG